MTLENYPGQYIELTVLANKNIKLELTEEGKEELAGLILYEEDNPEFFPAENQFWEMMEDIICNSAYDFLPDLSNDNVGLTNAPGIFYGNIDDNGDWELDTIVWWYPNYMVRSFVQDLWEKGQTIFTHEDN